MGENLFGIIGTPRFRRCLPALALLFCLWGCDSPAARPARRGGTGGSIETEVAQLLKDNVPFEFSFDLEDVNGQRLVKEDFAGKVLVVDLWGTWCPPCRMEIPHFIALHHKYQDQGLQVIGLNHERVSDPKQAARQVLQACREDGIDYPCALLPKRVADQVPDLEGFPTTLFIDRAGKVRLMVAGYHEMPFLQAVVETLLKEKAPGDVVATDSKSDAGTDSKSDDEGER